MEQQLGFEWIAASTICGSHSFDNLRWVGKFIEIAKLSPAGDRTSGRATVLYDCHTMSNWFSTLGEPLEFLLVDWENP